MKMVLFHILAKDESLDTSVSQASRLAICPNLLSLASVITSHVESLRLLSPLIWSRSNISTSDRVEYCIELAIESPFTWQRNKSLDGITWQMVPQ